MRQAFRYLAGGLRPDHKRLSEFLRRHRRAIDDVFTQVVQMARVVGMGRLGHVAIDSTRLEGRHVELRSAVQPIWLADRKASASVPTFVSRLLGVLSIQAVEPSAEIPVSSL